MGASHLVFCKGEVNSVRYNAQVVHLVLLPFLRQDGDVRFKQEIARLDATAVTQRTLIGAQYLPWPEKSPALSPIEHVWDMMKRELILSQEPAHNYCRIATTGTRCLGKSSAG